MKKIFIFSFVYCATIGISFAQLLPQQQQQTGESQQPTSTQSIQMPSLTNNMFTSSADFFRSLQTQGVIVQPPPYDTPVDTNTYVLGAGDVMNIGIWGATPLAYNMSVTPEGTLIVPAFGALDVGGKTLAGAKAYARMKLAEQFKKSIITLTLVYPRTIYVMVAGMVKYPGRCTVTSFDRVDKAFAFANTSKATMLDTASLPNFSLRRITLVHRDGTRENVDLLKFYKTGNLKDDPCLKEGDAIVVPQENFEEGSISISGAVKMPGNFEYVPGDRMKDLFKLSDGLTGLADSTHVRIVSWNGKSYEEKNVDLDDSSTMDMPLPVNSRVIVPTDRSKINDFYVWVTGEVKSPGIYPISRDSTNLTTIVDLAGGFTQWASLPTAAIFRVLKGRLTQQDIVEDTLTYTYRASGISEEELPYVSAEALMRENREVVSTNFVKLFVDKDSAYDCALRSGDSIYVPRSRNAVYVFGQVKYPGYIDYHSDWKYSDYVTAVGGTADGADKGNEKIIKGVTYEWYDHGGAKIEPGDFLFVPKVTIKPELYGWTRFTDILTVVGAVASIATTIVLVIRTSEGK
ncbi:MAG: SLBB domain-containing protein [Candidatus Kryptoniota bacterium]